MSWTGFATDLTLNDVVGPPLADASPPRFSAFTKPRADVYVTEDMLPPGPGKLRRAVGQTVFGLLVIGGVALALIDKPVKSESPAPDSAAGRPHEPVQLKKHAPKATGDTGDMTLEQFRKLSNRI